MGMGGSVEYGGRMPNWGTENWQSLKLLAYIFIFNFM